MFSFMKEAPPTQQTFNNYLEWGRFLIGWPDIKRHSDWLEPRRMGWVRDGVGEGWGGNGKAGKAPSVQSKHEGTSNGEHIST